MKRTYIAGVLFIIAALAALCLVLLPESSPPDSFGDSPAFPDTRALAKPDSSSAATTTSIASPSIATVDLQEFELDPGRLWVRAPDGDGGTMEEVTVQTPRQLLDLARQRNARPVVTDSETGRTRLLTEKVTVRLASSADPETVARNVGALRVESPDYAPAYTIFYAASGADVLELLKRLRHHPDTLEAEIQLARLHHKRALPNDTLIDDQWHLFNSAPGRTHINVEPVWGYGGGSAIRGNGILIGIVDDGLETSHPDFTGNIDTVNDWDWNGNDGNPAPGALDDHGTACAGIAAARGNNTLGVSGSAPEATLVGLRLIADYVTDSEEAEAMVWRQDLIHIKSNSWGPEDSGDILEAPGPLTRAAIASASTGGRDGLGTIFVWAGGNGGDTNDTSNYDGYANSIYTIAVGALDSFGERAYYSEGGANLHVVAPSDGGFLGITTTDLTGNGGYANGDYTDDFGGTSAATPVVAGIVALMLERNPALGWRDVQEILLASAHKVNGSDTGWTQNSGGFSFHPDFGSGLVDAQAAVTLAASWRPLGSLQTETASHSNLNQPIPENNAAGTSRTFEVAGTHMRVEQVIVTLNISHSARGNLDIRLTSPSGMVSRLADVRPDTGDHYDVWTVSSVRHWGESSDGIWRLTIADRDSSGNTNGGTLDTATLTLSGASAEPVNPPPVVQIVSPAPGAIFPPGSEVSVEI
nr:S8 family serine peptidase [Kiritimatiellia bacterium]